MNYEAHVKALVEAELAAMDTSKLHPVVGKLSTLPTLTSPLTPPITTTRLSAKYTTNDALPLVCAHAQARYLRTLAIHTNTNTNTTPDSPLAALAALEHTDLQSTFHFLDTHVISRKRRARDLWRDRARDQRQKSAHVTGFLNETWARRVNSLAASHVERKKGR